MTSYSHLKLTAEPAVSWRWTALWTPSWDVHRW